MKNIYRTLQDTDAGMLPVLAKFWKANLTGKDTAAAVDALAQVMLNRERAEQVWSSLTDEQRGVMQMLIGSNGRMPLAKFSRLFGEIRQMGAAQIERANPLDNPASVAEGLYYRGLISQAFEQADTGPRVVVYIPPDLLDVLPVRQTSYSNLKADAPVETAAPEVEPITDVQNIVTADTSIVDDMTTLLAYLQLHTPLLDNDNVGAADIAALLPHLLKTHNSRLPFLIGVGISADLIEVQAGKAYPKRAEARRWLAAPRAGQVQSLAEAWRRSAAYRDLWHVPGLHPDPGGELDEYDPAVARENFLELLAEGAPKQDWWSLEAFIEMVKATEPDFQRPGGDYESWYIRNDEGEYLQGFESWEAVEGALIEFYITGPMHWLGLVDRGEDAARLTAYGRAFLNHAPWPAPAEPEDKITLKEDGTILVSRKIARVDRFQIARFAGWVSGGDPYTYKVDANSVQRAAGQGINAGHISSFLGRMLNDQPLPPVVAKLLESWQGGPTAAVTLERLMVLRTTAPETMDKILDTPSLRRYLGARLGPMAVVVRPGQWEALHEALGMQGIQAEVVE